MLSPDHFLGQLKISMVIRLLKSGNLHRCSRNADHCFLFFFEKMIYFHKTNLQKNHTYKIYNYINNTVNNGMPIEQYVFILGHSS